MIGLPRGCLKLSDRFLAILRGPAGHPNPASV
jgi:hypothetical protein